MENPCKICLVQASCNREMYCPVLSEYDDYLVARWIGDRATKRLERRKENE